jgi:flagellin
MSVLRIYNNPLAINALRNLGITGSAISKSLERLSSGLRINRAADDAAGLSISEKLRAQIRGLTRASSNALDGISLIQTAEGALNEVHSILQRMRELSVQAANGIYTANDRQAIQLEVSQLTDEINRIASTTEFNTKTLLDGTLGALISTDDYTKVKAAVVGDVGKGGNFVMKAAVLSTGQLQVQKTDVFATTLQADAVGHINYLRTNRAHASLATAGSDGVGNTGVYQIEVPINANGSIAVHSQVDGKLAILSVVGSADTNTIGQNLQAEEISDGDKILFTVHSNNGIETFSVALSAGMTNAQFATAVDAALTSYCTAATFDNTATQTNFQLVMAGALNASITKTEFVDGDHSGGNWCLSFQSGSGLITSNRQFVSFSTSFSNNGASVSVRTARIANDAGTAFNVGNAFTGQVRVRFDTTFDFTSFATVASGGSAAAAADTITWHKYAGTNSLQALGKIEQFGPVATSGTFLISVVDFRTYAVFSFSNDAYTSLVAGGMDQTAATSLARGAQVGGNQSINAGFAGPVGSPLEFVNITFDGILQEGETATFNISNNNVLTGDQLSTLASLNRFTDFGVFNGRNNVELTVYQRGTSRSVTVNLFKNDTLEDMAGKLSLALYNPDGSGVINSGILLPGRLPDLVHVNTIGSAKGTVSITTPVPGAEIVFAGDESLLKALSLIEVRQGAAPVYSVSAFNLESAADVGSVKVSGNEIVGLLPGLKVFFDNTLGLRLDPAPPLGDTSASIISFGYVQATERPQISMSGNVESFFIHVAPRDFTLQVGANQGQTISSYISDMSALALGVEGLLVVDSKLAEESISIVDHAIAKVSSQRSRLGALQNRLESTIRNLDVAAENLTSSESRIRDADVAAETVLMTRNQILLNAGIAALAQANQLPQTVLQLLR